MNKGRDDMEKQGGLELEAEGGMVSKEERPECSNNPDSHKDNDSPGSWLWLRGYRTCLS